MSRRTAYRIAAVSAGGFSLVELMVALVIGLAATLVIMQMFAVSEARKRASTGGADAQTNAAVTLYQLERDIRQAGYGLAPNTQDFVPPYTAPPAGVLTSGILAQCATVRAYKKDRATTPDFFYRNSTFAPVLVNPANADGTPMFSPGDSGTDVILISYSGSSGMLGNGIDITQSGFTAQATADAADAIGDYVVVASRAGFNQGDLILAVPPLNALPGANDCTLGEVTGLPVEAPPTGSQCPPGITGLPNTINHNNVSYASVYTGCRNDPPSEAVWNKPEPGITYPAGSRLYNLGPVGTLVSRVYAVRHGSLTMCDLTVNDCTAPVADPPDGTVWTSIATGVVALRAQYGKDTDFDGNIDAWDSVQPTGTAHAQVVALRLVIVARSSQFEKEGEFTASAPVWHKDAAGTDDVTLDISASSENWQRYRYKAAQSIVPLRNMIWGQQQ